MHQVALGALSLSMATTCQEGKMLSTRIGAGSQQQGDRGELTASNSPAGSK
jgi:hypothetical protein